jgi:general secretion pathway protein G
VALGFGLTALVMSAFCSVHTVGERHHRARLDMMQLEQALRIHLQRTGQPLKKAEGLSTLVDRGILEALPQDPWLHEYGYALQHGEARLWSLGADGLPGGEGADKDLEHRFPLQPALR